MAYETNQMANSSMGMGYQARSVLSFLEGIAPDFADFKNGRYQININTGIWHNGREHGFYLVFEIPYQIEQQRLITVCTEGRNHDGIVVYHWYNTMTDKFNEIVTCDDMSEAAYDNFGYGNVLKVSNFIYSLAKKWYKKNIKQTTQE